MLEMTRHLPILYPLEDSETAGFGISSSETVRFDAVSSEMASIGPVSQQELSLLMADARTTATGLLGFDLMRERVQNLIARALTDHSNVDANEVDAILSAVRETGEYRARHRLGDPFAQQRARCIDVLTRLREQISIPRSQEEGRSHHAVQRAASAALGMRIRAARRNAGLTQAQLADKLEVHQGTIARWERGALAPNYRHRWWLADLLGGRPADYEAWIE